MNRQRDSWIVIIGILAIPTLCLHQPACDPIHATAPFSASSCITSTESNFSEFFEHIDRSEGVFRLPTAETINSRLASAGAWPASVLPTAEVWVDSQHPNATNHFDCGLSPGSPCTILSCAVFGAQSRLSRARTPGGIHVHVSPGSYFEPDNVCNSTTYRLTRISITKEYPLHISCESPLRQQLHASLAERWSAGINEFRAYLSQQLQEFDSIPRQLSTMDESTHSSLMHRLRICVDVLIQSTGDHLAVMVHASSGLLWQLMILHGQAMPCIATCSASQQEKDRLISIIGSYTAGVQRMPASMAFPPIPQAPESRNWLYLMAQSSASVDGMTVAGCYMRDYGGGIAMLSADSQLLVSGCNWGYSVAYFAGAMYAATRATITLIASDIISTISDNSAGGLAMVASGPAAIMLSRIHQAIAVSYGAGLLVHGGRLVIWSSDVTNSVAFAGGALSVSDGAVATVQGASRIQFNRAFTDGGGMHVQSVATIHLSGCSQVSHNTAKNIGGGIYGLQTAVVNCSGYARISENKADASAGIAVMLDSTLFMSGHATVKNNSAYGGDGTAGGGGILTAGSSRVYMTECSSLVGNSARQAGGGCMMHTGGQLMLSGYAMVHDNVALFGGGGLATIGSTMSMTDDVRVDGNSGDSGGGVLLQGGTLIMSGRATVANNSATRSKGLVGGGISARSMSVVKMYDDAQIVNNSATAAGGGMRVEASRVEMWGRARIASNLASLGGGLSAVGSDVSLFNRSAIGYNRGIDGGGIEAIRTQLMLSDHATVHDNTASMGGGLSLEETTLDMTGHACAVRNAASDSGGALIATGASAVTLHGLSSIRFNAALSGGAISGDQTTIHITDDAVISDNYAGHYGGGVTLVDGSTLYMNVNSSVTRNCAEERGGGVFMLGGSELQQEDSSQISYNAASTGGAVSLQESQWRIRGQSAVVNNTALQHGSAGYVEDGVLDCNTSYMIHGSNLLTGAESESMRHVSHIFANILGQLSLAEVVLAMDSEIRLMGSCSMRGETGYSVTISHTNLSTTMPASCTTRNKQCGAVLRAIGSRVWIDGDASLTGQLYLPTQQAPEPQQETGSVQLGDRIGESIMRPVAGPVLVCALESSALTVQTNATVNGGEIRVSDRSAANLSTYSVQVDRWLVQQESIVLWRVLNSLHLEWLEEECGEESYANECLSVPPMPFAQIVSMQLKGKSQLTVSFSLNSAGLRGSSFHARRVLPFSIDQLAIDSESRMRVWSPEQPMSEQCILLSSHRSTWHIRHGSLLHIGPGVGLCGEAARTNSWGAAADAPLIAAYNATLLLNATILSRSVNRTVNGSALHVQSSVLEVLNGGSLILSQNTALYGGAVYANSSVVLVHTVAERLGNTSLQFSASPAPWLQCADNDAVYGGCWFSQNTVVRHVGGWTVRPAEVQNNTAYAIGGGAFISVTPSAAAIETINEQWNNFAGLSPEYALVRSSAILVSTWHLQFNQAGIAGGGMAILSRLGVSQSFFTSPINVQLSNSSITSNSVRPSLLRAATFPENPSNPASLVDQADWPFMAVGGGGLVVVGGKVSLVGVWIAENVAAAGGGIAAFGTLLNINDTHIKRNVASCSAGGVICGAENDQFATIRLVSADSVANNFASAVELSNFELLAGCEMQSYTVGPHGSVSSDIVTAVARVLEVSMLPASNADNSRQSALLAGLRTMGVQIPHQFLLELVALPCCGAAESPCGWSALLLSLMAFMAPAGASTTTSQSSGMLLLRSGDIIQLQPGQYNLFLDSATVAGTSFAAWERLRLRCLALVMQPNAQLTITSHNVSQTTIQVPLCASLRLQAGSVLHLSRLNWVTETGSTENSRMPSATIIGDAPGSAFRAANMSIRSNKENNNNALTAGSPRWLELSGGGRASILNSDVSSSAARMLVYSADSELMLRNVKILVVPSTAAETWLTVEHSASAHIYDTRVVGAAELVADSSSTEPLLNVTNLASLRIQGSSFTALRASTYGLIVVGREAMLQVTDTTLSEIVGAFRGAIGLGLQTSAVLTRVSCLRCSGSAGSCVSAGMLTRLRMHQCQSLWSVGPAVTISTEANAVISAWICQHAIASHGACLQAVGHSSLVILDSTFVSASSSNSQSSVYSGGCVAIHSPAANAFHVFANCTWLNNSAVGSRAGLHGGAIGIYDYTEQVEAGETEPEGLESSFPGLMSWIQHLITATGECELGDQACVSGAQRYSWTQFRGALTSTDTQKPKRLVTSKALNVPRFSGRMTQQHASLKGTPAYWFLGCQLYSNSAGGDGGAITASLAASKPLLIVGSAFSKNIAHGGDGGALRLQAGTVYVVDSRITNNTSPQGQRGQIHINREVDMLFIAAVAANTSTSGSSTDTSRTSSSTLLDFDRNMASVLTRDGICDVGWVLPLATGSCVRCEPGGYSFVPGEPLSSRCHSCPSFTYCAGGQHVQILPGYFTPSIVVASPVDGRVEADPRPLHQAVIALTCVPFEACNASSFEIDKGGTLTSTGTTCGSRFRGVGCMECEVGYGRTNQDCVQCASVLLSRLLFWLLRLLGFVIAAASTWYKLKTDYSRKQTIVDSGLSIVALDHLQLLGLCLSAPAANLPGAFRALGAASTVLIGTPSEAVAAAQCVWPDSDSWPYMPLLIDTIQGVAFVALTVLLLIRGRLWILVRMAQDCRIHLQRPSNQKQTVGVQEWRIEPLENGTHSAFTTVRRTAASATTVHSLRAGMGTTPDTGSKRTASFTAQDARDLLKRRAHSRTERADASAGAAVSVAVSTSGMTRSYDVNLTSNPLLAGRTRRSQPGHGPHSMSTAGRNTHGTIPSHTRVANGDIGDIPTRAGKANDSSAIIGRAAVSIAVFFIPAAVLAVARSLSCASLIQMLPPNAVDNDVLTALAAVERGSGMYLTDWLITPRVILAPSQVCWKDVHATWTTWIVILGIAYTLMATGLLLATVGSRRHELTKPDVLRQYGGFFAHLRPERWWWLAVDTGHRVLVPLVVGVFGVGDSESLQAGVYLLFSLDIAIVCGLIIVRPERSMRIHWLYLLCYLAELSLLHLIVDVTGTGLRAVLVAALVTLVTVIVMMAFLWPRIRGLKCARRGA